MLWPATPQAIEAAARRLLSGGLVAFPTETVYGLGALAERPEAVRAIFAAKRRPPDHPLIVHLPEAATLSEWTTSLPPAARALSEAFWPGPLTLILPRHPRVPRVVTGGLDTLAVRVPAHPIARALLARVGAGVAAPSANRFGRVSATCAEHVVEGLGDADVLILDGGACPVGIESTIIDLSDLQPRLVRPGGIAQEAIEAILKTPLAPARVGLRAPGTLPSHYAPNAALELVAAEDLDTRLAHHLRAGRRVAILGPEPPRPSAPDGATPNARDFTFIRLPAEPEQAAPVLYQALREVDRRGCDLALCIPPATRGIGIAIRDRLHRAAFPRAHR